MDKKVFFCPVCGRVEAVDPSIDTTGKTCPFCGSVMVEKMTMNWDAVPPAARSEQRIKWVQEANAAQTFNVDTYNRRMADPVFANDDAGGPAVQQAYAAAPGYGAPYTPGGYNAQQAGAQFQAGVGNFSSKVTGFVNKGGKGMLWIKIIRILGWITLIGTPLFMLISGAMYSFGMALLFLLLGALAGIASAAAFMLVADAAENIMTIATNSADIATELKKEK